MRTCMGNLWPHLPQVILTVQLARGTLTRTLTPQLGQVQMLGEVSPPTWDSGTLAGASGSSMTGCGCCWIGCGAGWDIGAAAGTG